MKLQQCRPFDSRFLRLDLTENQREVYEAYGNSGSVVNVAARVLDKDPGAISKTIRAVQDKAHKEFGKDVWDEDLQEIIQEPLKILFFDIETAPNEAYVWGFYNQNIAHNQVKQYGHMISFAAKWLGTEDVIYHECRDKQGRNKSLIKEMLKLFDQADIVVGHNGRAFDVKTVKAEALKHDLDPPSPFKVADTFTIAKSEFKLHRNTLEYLAEFLGCTPKLKHTKFPGMDLWVECKKGNPEAWEEMRIYNIQDIDTLEEIYYRLRKWDSKSPNLAIFMEEARPICPKCGSGELKRVNPVKTNTQMYPGPRCGNCGGLSRGRKNITDKEVKDSLLVNAV